MSRITRHLIVHGRVQGVAYRDSMRIQAHALNITGWVRNRRDGTVEAMVQGEPEQVERIVGWARRGPPAAKVTNVDVTDGEGDYAAFEVSPTL